MSSLARQNLHAEVELSLNHLINQCLTNSNAYLAMYGYFAQDDVALHGCSKFFKHCSDEARSHAMKLIDYQNLRGGRLLLKDIQGPEIDSWPNGQTAVLHLLRMEKNLQATFVDVHGIADRRGDREFGHELAGIYLKEKEKTIKHIADHTAQLKRAGLGLGEYQFDCHLRK